MLQYAYTPYALIAVVSLMFTVPATAYLLWLRPKTTATYNLIGFLVCIIANLVVMYIYNAVLFFFMPLWPVQDSLVILGIFFLVRFAYSFPDIGPIRRSSLGDGLLWPVGGPGLWVDPDGQLGLLGPARWVSDWR